MTDWPEEVTIVEKVGEGRYYYINGRPCCAVGYMREDFPSWKVRTLFIKIYKLVALTAGFKSIALIGGYSTESINDSVDRKTRALYYNATMAVLGYTEGQSPEVLELAKEVRRIHKKEISKLFDEFGVNKRHKYGR